MENNKAYYAIIPANVRYDEELTPNAKLLYGEITALCNEKGYCWASNSYFADLYKTTTRSVSKWINQLIDKQYIYSEMIYKKNTKEVDRRCLYIGRRPIEEKDNTYRRKLPPPIEEKFQDNNTVINNTINNKYIYSRVIDYLNQKSNSNYKASTKKTQGLILARMNEGFNEKDFIKVIDNKCNDWLGTEYEQYLRPETLFGTKFESYLNQKVRKGKAYGSVNASIRQNFNSSESESSEYQSNFKVREKHYTDDEVADI